MKGTKARIFSYSFLPDKRMMHIAVNIRDTPGALNTVLEALRKHVNLAFSMSYSNLDGTATWSGFAEALSKADTEARIKKLLVGLDVVSDSSVNSSDDGLLVDTFHTGIELGPGEDFMLLPTKGVSHTYDYLTKTFGSGGDTILFDEGYHLGKVNARYFLKLMGKNLSRHKVNALVTLYRALGWADVSMTVGEKGARFDLTASDCFECSSRRRLRNSCSFMRGHMTGALSTIFDCELKGVEVECRFRGGSACRFELRQVDGGRGSVTPGSGA